MTKIGFIGLGNMGMPMAKNLVAAGHSVTAFDMVEAAREEAANHGMKVADSAGEAASDADLVITMLPNGKIVLSVFEAIVPATKKGATLIDCSTIDVESARKAHELCGANGLGSIDAPVSGGIGGAAAGTLTFMIGGSETSFEAAKPALEVMGGRLVHCGEGGAGQAAKICNNMLLGVSMIATCEAFLLAEKLGLDQKALFDVVSTSSGSCWSVNTYCPVPGVGPQSPADNGYKPGFAAALMLKDMLLSQEAATGCGQQTPMGEHASQLYQQLVDSGAADHDFSDMINFLKAGQN